MAAKSFKSGSKSVDEKKDVLAKRLQAHARKYGVKAIDQLYVQMTTAPEKAVRVSAANAILDRGFGRPTQASTTEHSGGININVSLKGSDKDL